MTCLKNSFFCNFQVCIDAEFCVMKPYMQIFCFIFSVLTIVCFSYLKLIIVFFNSVIDLKYYDMCNEIIENINQLKTLIICTHVYDLV